MMEASLEPSIISYSAGISACEKAGQWRQALLLLGELQDARLEPNVISYSAAISACEKGGQWQMALSLLLELRSAKLEPDAPLPFSVTTLGSARARRASCGRRAERRA
ncbi:unnamed protein product [Prorocentrum cordatum]|nr:unnamed protein product [Polarella glacialis]